MSLAAIRPWAQVAAVVGLALAAFPAVDAVASLVPSDAFLAALCTTLVALAAWVWRWAR